MKIEFSLWFFEKYSNIIFNENPYSGTDGRMDRRTDTVTKVKTKVILWSKHHTMTLCGRVGKSYMHTFSLDVGE